jgi:hypothetical protein
MRSLSRIKIKHYDFTINQTKFQFIYESRYATEVDVTIIYDDSPWSPIVAKEDVFKTDRVRLALRRGDVAAAAKEAKVFEMMPLVGE